MPNDGLTFLEQQEEKLRTKFAPDRIWECTECRAILGVLNAEKTELRVKRRDLYLVIEGSCQQQCRRCGQLNVLTDDDWLTFRHSKTRSTLKVK